MVAKDYTQIYNVDYQETLALIAKKNTMRVLLSLATNFDWSLHKFDVKYAFLNGNLEEEICMEVPLGFRKSHGRTKVCKLKKAL